jgi:CheY-like chemotaxis protein
MNAAHKMEDRDKPLIMVVDDDEDVLMWSRFVLEKEGYEIDCFSSREAAFNAIHTRTPDLIITDLMMDVLDAGFSFARRVKEDPDLPPLPIIIITAAESQRGFDFTPRNREDLNAMHADAFFSKPADPKNLAAKVAELLAGRN